MNHDPWGYIVPLFGIELFRIQEGEGGGGGGGVKPQPPPLEQTGGEATGAWVVRQSGSRLETTASRGTPPQQGAPALPHQLEA